MNIPSLERYPFDSTGEALTNRVENEEHIIPAGDKNKVFALLEGAAFSDSIKLRRTDGTYLRPWVDYQGFTLYPEATQATGEACTGLVKVLNESVVGKIVAEYQVVGGLFDHNTLAVEDLLWAGISDDRPVFWPDIKDRPLVFPPSPHTHDIFLDTYGWDARIQLVDTWTSEVLEEADMNRLIGIQHAQALIEQYMTSRQTELLAQIKLHEDTENAHADTKTTVGLDKVDNLLTATTDEARAANRADLRLTVGGGTAILTDALNTYSSNIMKQGILPVSRWGNLNYLQPGVAGSFEGSAQFQSHDRVAQLIEVDGTYVRLRPGSNGVDIGIYYDYITGVETNLSNADMVFTNNKYIPAALDQNYVPYQLMQTDGNVLMGLMAQKSALPQLTIKWWIAITNGTLDHTKHNCVEVSTPQVTLTDGSKLMMTSKNTNVFMMGDRIYAVTGMWDRYDMYRPAGAAATTYRQEFTVSYVTVASVLAGGIVSFTQITGITTTSLGRTRTGNGIIIANQAVGYPGEDCVLEYSGGLSSITGSERGWASPIMRAGLNGDGTVNLSAVMVYNITGGNSTCTSAWGFRLTFNPSTKTAVMLDNPQKHKWTETSAGGLSGNQLDNGSGCNPHTVAGLLIDDTYMDYVTSVFVSYNGYLYTTLRHGSVGQNTTFNIKKINGFTNRDEVNANPAKFTYTVVRNVTDAPPFGSNNKGLVRHPSLFPGNVLFYYSKNTTTMQSVGLYQKLLGEPTFQYKLLLDGTMNGYPPLNDRPYASRSNPVREIITEVNSAGNVVTHCACASVWQPTGPSDVQPNLTTSGQADIAIAELNTQMARVVAASATGLTKYQGSLIIPRNTSIPLMLKITGLLPKDANGNVWSCTIVATVTYNGNRTGVISGWSANTDDIQYGIQNTGSYDISINYGVAGHVFYQMADGNWLFMLAGFLQTLTTGPGAQLMVTYGQVNTATKKMNGSRFRLRPESPYADLGSRIPIALPGKGIYVTDTESYSRAPYSIPYVYQSGGAFALVARYVGTTLDSLIDWDDGNLGTPIVLTANVVEQGWILYFTEAVPVILNGREGTVPVTTVDLRDISSSPGNRTYYVYVKEANGTMSYQITTTEQTPTMGLMYVGYITTSSTQIQTISVSKRSRIGIYQLSDTRTGLSVPVSTGLPFQVGDWSWD